MTVFTLLRSRALLWFVCLYIPLMLAGFDALPAQAYQPSPPLPRSEKRLLQWGWNTPFLQQMPSRLSGAQHLPFDGIITDVWMRDRNIGLSWLLFGEEQFDRAALEQIARQYSGLHWGRFTDNFLRVNVMPGTVDWFDNFDSILYNFETIAGLARILGFRGIMFDTEQYGGLTLFSYPHRKYKNLHSHDEYKEQAYLRGRQAMRALNRGYPGITVLYTHSLSFGAQRGNAFDGSRHGYGLMMPFIDGMIRAADDNTMLVDAFESAYSYRQEAEFAAGYHLIKHQTRFSFARHPRQYGEKVRAGFGVWLDNSCSRNTGLQAGGCSGGFTPQSFRRTVEIALQYSDRYVWVYSQSINWFTGEGIPADWGAVLPTIGQ